MKRTPLKAKKGFKTLTFEEAVLRARTALRKANSTPKRRVSKKKVQSISKLKKQLWEECKRIIRKTYVKEDGTWECFTCGRRIDEPFKAQTGHFLPSSTCGAYLRYDLRNLRIQDYFCNINLGGNGAEYYKRLVQTCGQKYVDQLFLDKQKTIKADTEWYLKKIEEYRLL